MKILRPFTVTDSNLVSSVAEAGTFPEYSVTTNFALGDVVISSGGASPTHHSYESLVADNLGNALDDVSKWLDLGPTNRWAMFDNVNGTATTDAAGIDATVTVTGRADGLALLAMDATQVRVIVTAGAYGTVYDQTYDLQSDSGITSWYDYFSEEITYSPDLVLTDLPIYTDPVVTVQIDNTNGSTSCGLMILGQSRELGGTAYGAKAGIQDYSRKETDAFGNYTLVARAYAKRNTYRITCENEQVDSIFNLLAELRATPVVWLGTDDYAMTWAFGWARDWAIEIAYPTKSFLSIEIEGLT